MGTLALLGLVAALAAGSFFLCRSRARVRGPDGSLPRHYGMLAALWVLLPSLGFLLAWPAVEAPLVTARVVDAIPESVRAGLSREEIGLLVNRVRVEAGRPGGVADPALAPAAEAMADARGRLGRMRALLALLVALLGGLAVALRVGPGLRARVRVERTVTALLAVSSWVAVLTTVGILASMVFEAFRFFRLVSPPEFLFGAEWSPQTAIREGQAGASGSFGAIPIFAGTFLVSALALLVAVPVGLMSAIYMAEYATPRVRAFAKPALEILAGIPTVVYGFFAVVTVAPFVRGLAGDLGVDIAAESALVAGAVMGVMIIPFVSSLSDDVIAAVPRSLRDGSLALGSTRSEMLRRVVLPAALPGIVGAVLLAASRAIGETMIVVMAAGLSANLTLNPLEAVTTATVQIVTLLVGDQEFDSAKTLSAFALGLTLFVVTLGLNVVALRIVRRYRERY